MRNPLKKLQKKINVRLANNAAKHSQQQPTKGSSPDRRDSTSRSLTEQDCEDPLFNNRSSKLRLALAETKKPNQEPSPVTTPTKKKKKGRLSVGSSSSSTRRNSADSANEAVETGVRSTSSSPQKSSRSPMTGPSWGPRRVSTTTAKAATAADAGKKTTAPTTASKSMDPNLERIAKAAAALDNTGNALFEKGEYDKAMASYVKALKLKNRTLAGKNLDDTNPIAAHARPQLPNSNPSGTTKPAPTEADELWISVATSINNIGYLRQQSGQASAEETMQAYKNSLEIKRRVLGNDNLSVGKTLNNLGTVHYLKREYEAALEAYQEALEIMMASLGPRHLDVGTVHSNMGDVYWAQSGEVKKSEESFQASRNAALQHYRVSLEIRWEQLHDHHDPKVIRLLEKIAALEMGENFLALVQNNNKYRLVPKGDSGHDENNPANPAMDADEALEAESSKHVYAELQTLHEEVRSDVKQMDMMQRKMAIDMVKDKLRLIREMKKLSNLDLYTSFDDEDDDEISLGSPTSPKAPPLSPLQRSEALCAVKERLKQLRDSRSKEKEPYRRYTTTEVSDLKEADRSPSNFFSSHKASQLLNRKLQHPPTIDALDELRKFSFHNENEPEGNEIKEPKPSVEVGRKESHALEDGIDALRSLSMDNQANIPIPKMWNPWVVAATMASPEKSNPSTPKLTSTMAAF